MASRRRTLLPMLAVWPAARLLAGRLAFAVPAAPRLSWYGQSCFLLETPRGTRILMDPTVRAANAAAPEELRAGLVTISHEHADHNNVGLVPGSPRILRGLTRDRKGWMKVRETYEDVSIRTIGVYHDQRAGKERGLNTIFVLETAGVRIAHLGDLGHTLSNGQLSDLGQVDVVLIPVGGRDTIDADQAAQVMDQIRPRLFVIPMHYETGSGAGEGLAAVDSFLAGRPHVRRLEANAVEITSLKKRPGTEVLVLAAP